MAASLEMSALGSDLNLLLLLIVTFVFEQQQPGLDWDVPPLAEHTPEALSSTLSPLRISPGDGAC